MSGKDPREIHAQLADEETEAETDITSFCVATLTLFHS